MTDLITRLRDGEGADRELDDAISEHFDYWNEIRGVFRNSPTFTSSLDACIALAERVLPGQLWMKHNGSDGSSAVAFYPKRYSHRYIDDCRGEHKSLCRAFLIALITAKEASHDFDAAIADAEGIIGGPVDDPVERLDAMLSTLGEPTPSTPSSQPRRQAMTAEWKPSEEMVNLAGCRMSEAESEYPRSHYGLAQIALIAARPLMREEILAEERPKIEAAERERVLEEAALFVERKLSYRFHKVADDLRALKQEQQP